MNRFLPPQTRTLSPGLAAPAVAALLALVGWVDFVTGSEIRVMALYFVPLMLAGWLLSQAGAAISALLAASVWLGVMYASGTRFQHGYVWAINGLTDGSAFVIVAVLVARLHDALDQEAVLSRTDQLTGLSNRRALTEIVTREIAHCRRHARAASMICLDLNNFKAANDTFGHDHGDDLLRQFAQLMRTSFRTCDTIARLGGDEFIVFLPETNAQQAALLVARIHGAVTTAAAFRLAGVSVSIGTYSQAPIDTDMETMLRQADLDMYRTKRLRASVEPVMT